MLFMCQQIERGILMNNNAIRHTNVKKMLATAIAGLGLMGSMMVPLVANADTTTATTTPQ